MITHKYLGFLLVSILCFAGAWLWNESTPKTPAASASIQSDIVQKSKYKHARIADIKVGDKVVVSTDDTEKPTSVDPSTWKKLTLYAEEIWQDGTVDTINIETLVPPDWVALNDAQTGSMIPIPLDLEEMGLDQGMLAKVTAISPCPEIRAGPGRVVLTTVNHLNRGVCELTYRSENNQQETIKTTGAHRFYSVDRQKWIHIHDSSPGERLQGLGTEIITVLSCNPLGTTERVYNMTVEEDHVYHVGQLNLLAHNNGCEDIVLFRAPSRSEKSPNSEVLTGFSSQIHPNNGPYFATLREIAEEYQYNYRNGLIEVHITKESFDQLCAKGILLSDGYYPQGISWYVPAEKLTEFNKAIKSILYHPE